MIITHAKVITWTTPNQILEDHGVYLDDGLIREVAPSSEIKKRHPDSEELNAEGKLLLPGNICAHTHFYGAFARGMAIPGTPPKDFPAILGKLWWPLDRSLTEQDVRSSALVCLVDAIRHGTTTLFDHHASPGSIPGCLDVIADAVTEAGLRAVLCYEVSDRDGREVTDQGIRENIRFIEHSKSRRPFLGAAFGLHASLTLSDGTLDRCRELVPAGYGFHIHAAESDSDQCDSMSKSGTRAINRLHAHGILGPESILAHCVHVDEREIDLLAETRTWITHQPRSNMNNGVGIAPVETMLKAGVRLGLGNDGFSNAMWEEWKAAYLVHKAWHSDPTRMSANDVKRMAVDTNAQLATQFLGLPIGRIESGAAGDLILVDYHPFTELTPENLPWHIVFGFHESMITSTIVNGRLLMHDRKLLTLDEEAISRTAQQLSKKVWNRYQENAR